MKERFRDEHKRITEFQNEVWVVCPACRKRAVASIDCGSKKARLLCAYCSYHREVPIQTESSGIIGSLTIVAHRYFEVGLWLQHPFKNDVFFAYNDAHLGYLESYISAKLREHRDRTHFTLLEKLPKFYHEGKNRQALLKIIERLKARA